MPRSEVETVLATGLDVEAMVGALDRVADEVAERLGPALATVAATFRTAYRATLATTIRPRPDGTVFVLTGDIPAMWLRDSAAQVRPYLPLAATDNRFAELLVGVSRRQLADLAHDPYANAFNEHGDGACWDPDDQTDRPSPRVWERKFELDSLCYPVRLAHDLHQATGRTDHLDDGFVTAANRLLDTWDAELDHERTSPYRFVRAGHGLTRAGLGTPTAPNGLVWSGFRPSDDPCQLHLHVPSNAFAAVAAALLAELLDVVAEPALAHRARQHADRIRTAVWEHGTVDHPDHGRVLGYEVDGLGGSVLMDDANLPSLLSLPYLGFCAADDPTYLRTRALLLSPANPYWFTGTAATGIGSPHLRRPRMVWPIALAAQALTATDPDEREGLLRTLATTTAGTGLLHEAFDVDDPSRYTRPWFGWANALFSEAVLVHAGLFGTGTRR